MCRALTNLPNDISSIMRRTIKDFFVFCFVAHNVVVVVVVVVLQSNLNHDYQVDRLNANEEETKKAGTCILPLVSIVASAIICYVDMKKLA